MVEEKFYTISVGETVYLKLRTEREALFKKLNKPVSFSTLFKYYLDNNKVGEC